MSLQIIGREYRLRAHLIAFGLAAFLPMTILAGLLLVRSAAIERAELEARLLNVAENLAADLDRDLSNLITTLNTLARAPALRIGDLAAFHAQASAAVQGLGGAIFLVDPNSLQQVLNTLVPWGTPLPRTGDAKTVLRVRDTQQPQVSDYFVGVVSKQPTFNVDVPILQEGKLRYVLMLGLEPEHLLPILQAQILGPEWISVVVDRDGIVLARTRNHAEVAGKAHSTFAVDLTIDQRGLVTSKALEGEPVLRAGVRSQLSGWRVMCSVPVALAEAPLRRSLQQWSAAAALALAITLAAAWWLGRAMERPMRAASDAAAALGRGGPIAPLQSSIAEANSIVAALQNANSELTRRADQKHVLMQELSHRVKNIISVIQALASRTLSEERSIAEARVTLLERLQALARAHNILVVANWGAAPLKALVAAELAPFAKRAIVSGPEILVEAGRVQTFAMMLHELATNAAKHGALSVDQGSVSVTWSVEGSGSEQRFKLRWEEAGGPPVQPPAAKGFGTVLLQDALASEKITCIVRFDPGGLVYELEGKLHDVGLHAAMAAAQTDTQV